MNENLSERPLRVKRRTRIVARRPLAWLIWLTGGARLKVMDAATAQRDAGFRVLSPVPRDVWESLTGSCPDLVATQALPWRDAVMASGAYKDVSLLYEFSSGRQVLLPMVQRRWRTPLEPTAASWPRRWGVGGPVTSGGSIDRSVSPIGAT